MRLFCLPFAGAGASSFAPLSRRLGDTVEVCAVQLPGRESRMQERCIGSVEALVAALEFSMRELMDCPYAILGYSMGASIALELCRRLRGGILPQPVALFVVGAPGPRVPKRPPIAGLPTSSSSKSFAGSVVHRRRSSRTRNSSTYFFLSCAPTSP